MLNWMAWTLPTGIFFSVIAVTLAIMTFCELKWPCVERKGFLPITTTRGDRLFIGLLCSGFIHLTVLGLSDWPITVATGLSLLWIAIVLRWG